jgi:antitoxin component YwqK of YwqJK toxin-antitoxin module
MPAELNIAEVPYESGALHFRYSRILAADGKRWLRHGLFVEYSDNGTILSEGNYHLGKEQGLWRDYYPNGNPAAEGTYEAGLEHGVWRFWDETGNVRQTIFVHGEEREPAA